MSKDVIVLTGIKETLAALETFDKNAVKEFNKLVSSELRNAKKDAQGFVTAEPPLSGWATQPASNPRSRGGAGWPAWDQSVIKDGISVSRAQRRARKDYTTSAGALVNKSAAGVIYELAGRRNRKGVFVKNLEGQVGSASRLIWKSVDKNRSKIEQNVSRTLENLKLKLQQNLNKERG